MTTAKTIWLVNDEPYVLQALGMMLRQACPGVKIEEFAGGLAAWNELAKRQPQLLITGDIMPGLRGCEIAERLHQRGDVFPIIVTSGWLSSEQWVDALAAQGMNIQFLPMPMTVGQLLDSVHRAWGEPLES